MSYVSHKLIFNGETLGVNADSGSGDIISDGLVGSAQTTVDVVFKDSVTGSVIPIPDNLRKVGGTTVDAIYTVRVISTKTLPQIHGEIISLCDRLVGKTGELLMDTTVLSKQAIIKSIRPGTLLESKGAGYALSFEFTLIGGAAMTFYGQLLNGNFDAWSAATTAAEDTGATNMATCYGWTFTNNAGAVPLTGAEPYGAGGGAVAYFNANGTSILTTDGSGGNSITQTLTRVADLTTSADYMLRVTCDVYFDVRTADAASATMAIGMRAGASSTWANSFKIYEVPSSRTVRVSFACRADTLYAATGNLKLCIGSAGTQTNGQIFVWNVAVEEVTAKGVV